MGHLAGSVPVRLRHVLPRGEVLAPAAWRVRHWLLVTVLLVHVPWVAVAGEGTPVGVIGAVGPVLVAVAVAALAPWRVLAAGAVALGLAWSAGVTVVGMEQPALGYAHVALVVVAAGLYQSWTPLLLSAGHGLALLGTGGLLAPQLVHGQWGANAPMSAVIVSCALVVAASLLTVGWWAAAEYEQQAARREAARVARRERQVAERLASVEAMKAQLIAIVAHEFRTPLTSITGFARTLTARQGQLDKEAVQACLDGIDHHTRRLTRLVHNIIAASGEVAIDHTAATDLGELAQDLVQESTATHRQGVDVRVRVPPRLEAAIDPIAAKRIIGNLCDNAIKFAPRGTLVEIIGSRLGSSSVLEIANELVGVSAGDLEAMFEPFTQADSSDTRPVEGLGLGLHVARLMARAHDGELDARLCGNRIIVRLSLPVPGRLRHREGEDRITVIRGT